MRKLTLIGAIAIFFAACSSNQNNPTPGPTPPGQPNADLHWVPNWSNDTICGNLIDSNGWEIGKDTILTVKRGDTSLIVYKGTEYYVWINSDKVPFKPDNDVYSQGNIGLDPMNMATRLTWCSVFPPKYYDADYGIWKEQYTHMIIDLKPPFPENVNGGYYSSRYK